MHPAPPKKKKFLNHQKVHTRKSIAAYIEAWIHKTRQQETSGERLSAFQLHVLGPHAGSTFAWSPTGTSETPVHPVACFGTAARKSWYLGDNVQTHTHTHTWIWTHNGRGVQATPSWDTRQAKGLWRQFSPSAVWSANAWPPALFW